MGALTNGNGRLKVGPRSLPTCMEYCRKTVSGATAEPAERSPFLGKLARLGWQTKIGGEMKKLNHFYMFFVNRCLFGGHLFTIIVGVYKLYFWLLDLYSSRKQKMLAILFACYM